ncbi:conserved hypothetical protein [Desulfotalea psychrophila LSv54]|uniref:PPM-type phosphatase domain-containing protein n=2 Tax=Desulfotalea psychrophila TaxID=84980 RepID=Q6AKH8_DESPS|nr:conserved hypothetical protein [Desulfotalea psychrophila LSv54]
MPTLTRQKLRVLGKHIFSNYYHNKLFIMDFKAYALTDKGLSRDNNEDCFVIADKDPEQGTLYAVADGMGGYAAGETASRIICFEVEKQYFQHIKDIEAQETVEEKDICFLLEKIVYKINKKILSLGKEKPHLFGMGSTLSLLLIRKNRAYTVQVGDSRIYRVRNKILEQLTEDQTEVQRYVNMGRLTAEEAVRHHLRHVLSQAIGGKRDSLKRTVVDVYELQQGDQFLLCSDGLYGMICADEITAVLNLAKTGKKVVQKLIGKALDAGGKDNVSAVLVQPCHNLRSVFLSIFGCK